MPQKPHHWRSLLSTKHLLAGTLLLLAGLGATVYNNTRPPPPPVERLPPVALQPQPELTPSPSPEDSGQTVPVGSPASPRLLKVTRQRVEEEPPPPPVVTVTSPEAGATFTAPATITYSASVSPDRERVSKVEFFSAVNPSGEVDSICNNSRDIQIPGAPLEKRGEVTKEPYSFTDTGVAPGSYVVYVVVTNPRGVRQISRPVPILVHDPFSEGEIEGWHPKGVGLAVPPTPTPSPTPAPTPTPVPCLKLKLEYLKEVIEGTAVSVTARVERAAASEDFTFKWKLSAGKIIGGVDSSSITVGTRRLGGTMLSFEVEVSRAGTECVVKSSGALKVLQPDGGNTYAPPVERRLDNFAIELQNDPSAQGYIIAYGGVTSCAGAAAAKAQYARSYLTKVRGIDASRLVAVDGGLRENDGDELWIVPAGASPPEPTPTVQREAGELTKCSAGTLKAIVEGRELDPPPPRHPYTKCPDIAERLHFITTLGGAGEIALNTCPHNPRDPQNDALSLFNKQLDTTVKGIFGKELSYGYTTNGGVLGGEGASVTWDLSSVMLSPGLYTAAVEVDDGCGCTGVATTPSVLITNFCTPCFSVSQRCVQKENKGDRAVRLFADVPEWAAEKSPGFSWVVDKGRIAEGQNSPDVVIDTSGLEEGEEIIATVEVSGLYGYCVNKLSYTAIVGLECNPEARKFDGYGSINDIGLRRAKTRKRAGPEVTYVEGGAAASGTPEPHNGGETGGDGRPKENEYLKIAWPEVVETQRSFSVVVRYNRTKDELELTDETGRVTERINVEARKLLRDWWGPGYEVWGTVKLQSSALGCANWCRDEFKPLSGAEQKWTFNLKTDQAGEHSFNLELWIEGRPSGGGRAFKDAEPVWSKDSLKIVASDKPPTKTHLAVFSVFSCLAGAGFFIRGIKFGNVKIMLAGGDIVGGDKVGGDKVGGDKVGGDKRGE